MMDVDFSSEPSSSQSPPDQCRNWLELPRDVMASILLKLGAVEILMTAQRVCSLWRSICREPSMWRSIDMHNLGDLYHMGCDLRVMCREAVDRSCGGLVDINIEYFGDDDLLMYIADRSAQLKHLRLMSCYDISEEGLIAAIGKFPLLEDLEFSLCNFAEKVIEASGRCCPLLTSFKFNNQACIYFHPENEEEALAIAKNMSGLRHLQIFGNNLSNDGLRAILDGCLHLESLDLRRCYNINLDGQLGGNCAERVKYLRQPHDPTDDYPLDLGTDDLYASEEEYPNVFSDIEFASDDDDDGEFEFSGGSDFYDSDYADLYYD